MTSLIDRIEAATGPDRELDLAIAVALNYRDAFDPSRHWQWGAGGDEIEGHHTNEKGRRCTGYLDPAQFVPRYTGSIWLALGAAIGSAATIITIFGGMIWAAIWAR